MKRNQKSGTFFPENSLIKNVGAYASGSESTNFDDTGVFLSVDTIQVQLDERIVDNFHRAQKPGIFLPKTVS